MNKLSFKATLLFALTVCLLLAVSNNQVRQANAQQQHDQHHAQSGDKWAEMEEFHKVMSQTFHLAEEGRLEPIRKRAGEMADKAKKWLDSKPPKVYDTPDIKALLAKLSVESKALADAVAKNASDEQIKKDLTALHDRFHEIVGACRDEKKKHQ